MYELGTKYYFEKVPSGNYIAAAFSTIINTRVRDLTDEFIPVNINSKSYLVNYSSKEIKLMLGKASDASEKFYTDFAFGGGLRFLKYDDVKFTTQDGPALEINRSHAMRGWRFQTKFPNEIVHFLPIEMQHTNLKTATFTYHVLCPVLN